MAIDTLAYEVISTGLGKGNRSLWIPPKLIRHCARRKLGLGIVMPRGWRTVIVITDKITRVKATPASGLGS